MFSLRVALALLLLYNMSVLPVPLNVRAEHQAVLELPTVKPRPTLPVANATESFWLRSPNVSPSPTHGSDGPLTADADICIIGSGITGVSSAYHLAKSFSSDAREKPVTAVILEAREFCEQFILDWLVSITYDQSTGSGATGTLRLYSCEHIRG